ncbi:MAG: hypothetical protein ABSE68_03070 [Minisyncoccia bacterium]
MRTLLKYVFWIAITGGVVYGGYYAYQNWLKEDISTGNIANQASSLGKTVLGKAGDYAKSAVSSTKSAAGSVLKNQIGSFIGSVGEQIYSAGMSLSGATTSLPAVPGSAVNPTIQSGSAENAVPSGNITTPTSSVFDIPPPPATIIIPVKSDFSLSINSGQVYKVDWGDGNKDQGATTAGNITILHHVWKDAGDYPVNVTVGNSVSSNYYSFPVRVY